MKQYKNSIFLNTSWRFNICHFLIEIVLALIFEIYFSAESSKMLSKCCCCIPLRVGSIILAVLGIIGGLLNIGYYSNWGYVVFGIFYFIANGCLLYGAIKNNHAWVLVYLVFSGISIVLEILFGILVLASVEYLVPMFANNCALINDELRDQKLSIEDCDTLKSATEWTLAAVFMIGALFNIYFWICNLSFYKELKQ